MLTNNRHLSFNNIGDLLLFPMKVYINKSSMENILSFVEGAKIAGVHNKIDTPKEKVINVHIKDGEIIHFKACAEILFYTNINDPIIITNPTNVSLDDYSYLSTILKNRYFKLILTFKDCINFKGYSNILTGLGRQILRLTYAKE